MLLMVYIKEYSIIFEELFEEIYYNIFGIVGEVFNCILDVISKAIYYDKNEIKINNQKQIDCN